VQTRELIDLLKLRTLGVVVNSLNLEIMAIMAGIIIAITIRNPGVKA